MTSFIYWPGSWNHEDGDLDLSTVYTQIITEALGINDITKGGRYPSVNMKLTAKALGNI